MPTLESTITPADLASALTGDPAALDVHLQLVERDIAVAGHLIKVHCHCLTLDGNGRVQPSRLAEFMRNAVADYAIPRSKLSDAKERDKKFNSTEAVTELVEQARRSFTDLAKTGEGGEMLLFLLAERFLGLPQILCKMDLKTDSRMHYHGADGVYAGITDDGILKLYWGESKLFASATSAISACLASLAPFLVEPDHEGAERERDLLLLSDKADLSDARLSAALQEYFRKTSTKSKRVRYCGIGLVGYSVGFYPSKRSSTTTDAVVAAAKADIQEWLPKVAGSVKSAKLDGFELELLCIPMPSVDGFRSDFLRAMGLKK